MKDNGVNVEVVKVKSTAVARGSSTPVGRIRTAEILGHRRQTDPDTDRVWARMTFSSGRGPPARPLLRSNRRGEDPLGHVDRIGVVDHRMVEVCIPRGQGDIQQGLLILRLIRRLEGG